MNRCNPDALRQIYALAVVSIVVAAAVLIVCAAFFADSFYRGERVLMQTNPYVISEKSAVLGRPDEAAR